MSMDQNVFNQIALTLARHFEGLYYVELETGNFKEFLPSDTSYALEIPSEGKDFLSLINSNADKYVHPRDLAKVLKFHVMENLREALFKNGACSVTYRLVLGGTITYVRHIIILCDDKKHALCCLENVDAEYKEREEQKKNLRSAEQMARRDDMTGIRNKNAFNEYSQELDQKIRTGKDVQPFGILMCDINDLKHINDTRGHSFGDEMIQLTSHMISGLFKNSPVYRVGGDEFVVALSGSEYEQRESLLDKLREESEGNRAARSGPVVASGLAVYDPERDKTFLSVYERADQQMYENKKELKSRRSMESVWNVAGRGTPYPDERRRRLDILFGALYTVAGEGYIYLNDLRYDYSRWSHSLVEDFGLKTEYMYDAGREWQKYVHPDDIDIYTEAVDLALSDRAEVRPLYYRARRADGTYVLLTTRACILADDKGEPEYFAGIILPQIE